MGHHEAVEVEASGARVGSEDMWRCCKLRVQGCEWCGGQSGGGRMGHHKAVKAEMEAPSTCISCEGGWMGHCQVVEAEAPNVCVGSKCTWRRSEWHAWSRVGVKGQGIARWWKGRWRCSVRV